MSARIRAFSSGIMLVLALGAALVSVVLVSMNAATTVLSTAATEGPERSVGSRANLLLARLGLDPQTLAAAGLTSQQAAGVIGRVTSGLDTTGAAIEGLAADESVARQSCSEIERRVREGRPLQGDASDLTAARSLCAAKQSALTSALGTAFDQACEGLSDGVKDRLRTIHANRSWQVPIQYRCVNRSESEWIQLRGAVLAARAASRENREPSESTAQVLQQADANSDVVAAKAALDANLAGIQTACRQALEPQ